MYQFKDNPHGTNQVMRLTKTSYVSFNTKPWRKYAFLSSDDGGSETALVIDGVFLILKGDWRKEYVEAANEDIASCVDVFLNNREHISTWSTEIDIEEWLAKRLERMED